MHYKEDFWYVEVLPINVIQKNSEIDLDTVKGKQTKIKDK
jgi:hypothetical protein